MLYCRFFSYSNLCREKISDLKDSCQLGIKLPIPYFIIHNIYSHNGSYMVLNVGIMMSVSISCLPNMCLGVVAIGLYVHVELSCSIARIPDICKMTKRCWSRQYDEQIGARWQKDADHAAMMNRWIHDDRKILISPVWWTDGDKMTKRCWSCQYDK